MNKFLIGFKDAWAWFPDLTDSHQLGVVTGCLSFGIAGSFLVYGFANLMGRIERRRRKNRCHWCGANHD